MYVLYHVFAKMSIDFLSILCMSDILGEQKSPRRGSLGSGLRKSGIRCNSRCHPQHDHSYFAFRKKKGCKDITAYFLPLLKNEHHILMLSHTYRLQEPISLPSSKGCKHLLFSHLKQIIPYKMKKSSILSKFIFLKLNILRFAQIMKVLSAGFCLYYIDVLRKKKKKPAVYAGFRC